MNSIDAEIKSTDLKLTISALAIFGIAVVLVIVFFSLKRLVGYQVVDSGYEGCKKTVYYCATGSNMQAPTCVSEQVPCDVPSSSTGPFYFDSEQDCLQSCTGACTAAGYTQGEFAVNFFPTVDGDFCAFIVQSCPTNPTVPSAKPFGIYTQGVQVPFSGSQSTIESIFDQAKGYNQGLVYFCDAQGNPQFTFSPLQGQVIADASDIKYLTDVQCSQFYTCGGTGNNCDDSSFFPSNATSVPAGYFQGKCSDGICNTTFSQSPDGNNFVSINNKTGKITDAVSTDKMFVLSGTGTGSSDPNSFCAAQNMYWIQSSDGTRNTCCFNPTDTVDTNTGKCVSPNPGASYRQVNGVYGCFPEAGTSQETTSPQAAYFSSMQSCKTFMNNAGVTFSVANPSVQGLNCDLRKGPQWCTTAPCEQTLPADTTNLWPDTNSIFAEANCVPRSVPCDGFNYATTTDYILLYPVDSVPTAAKMATNYDLLRMSYDTSIAGQVMGWCLGALYVDVDDNNTVKAGYPSNKFSGEACGNGQYGIVSTGTTSQFQWCKVTIPANQTLTQAGFTGYTYNYQVNQCYEVGATIDPTTGKVTCENGLDPDKRFLIQCGDICLPNSYDDKTGTCSGGQGFTCSSTGENICTVGGTLSDCSSCCPSGTSYCKNPSDETKSTCCPACSSCSPTTGQCGPVCGVDLRGCSTIDSITTCADGQCVVKDGANNVVGKKWTTTSSCPETLDEFNKLETCTTPGPGCVYWTGPDFLNSCDIPCQQVISSLGYKVQPPSYPGCVGESILEFGENNLVNPGEGIDWMNMNVCVEEQDSGAYRISPCYDAGDPTRTFTYNNQQISCPFTQNLDPSIQCKSINQWKSDNNPSGQQWSNFLVAWGNVTDKGNAANFCIMTSQK